MLSTSHKSPAPAARRVRALLSCGPRGALAPLVAIALAALLSACASADGDSRTGGGDRDAGSGEICDNTIDDDGDGAVDCEDGDCAARSECRGGGGEICDNTIDDDGDRLVDCSDPDCADDGACAGELCDNGADDDGDGAIDCDDTECAGDEACADGAEICDNGTDDDGDGATDCDDSDCSDHTACQAGVENCANGTDDDDDGDVDCDDTECATSPLCSSDTEICDNGVDDDGNGARDCADPACADDPACGATCGDGVVEGSEECDGTQVAGCEESEICSDECRCFDPCGDGELDDDEECDEGDENGAEGSRCSATCEITPVCGDEVVDEPEECDGDFRACGVEARCVDCTCVPVVCGDDVVEGSEECDGDDAACGDGQRCNADCGCEPIPVCGNGALEGAEECETGEDAPRCEAGSLCNEACICEPIACGDGVVEGAEACDGDDAACGDGRFCRPDCTCGSDTPTRCTAHLQRCDSADDGTDSFFCDIGLELCLTRCDALAADDTESGDCPTGSWCFELTDAPDPALGGACLPGDCTSFFRSDTECEDSETCFPRGNGASFCQGVGEAEEGADCNVVDVADGETRPPSDICGPELICYNNVCTQACDQFAGDSSCDSTERCVDALGGTGTNRPGLCGRDCTPFSSRECRTDEVCSPLFGGGGVAAWMCLERLDAEPAPIGEPCDPDGLSCVEGGLCFNEGDIDGDGEDDFLCRQLCDPDAGEDDAFGVCEDEQLCFPTGTPGLGSCLDGCEPYPRRGDGGYEGCSFEDSTCRPFADSETRFEEPQGACVPASGELTAFMPCERDLFFGECRDWGLCADLDFDEMEDPNCKPLCEPFSSGTCGGGAVCSPLLTLFDPAFALCERSVVPAREGQPCDASRFGQWPCQDDGTLCLSDGRGGACVRICREGVAGDCGAGTTCNAGVFSDAIAEYFGVCL